MIWDILIKCKDRMVTMLDQHLTEYNEPGMEKDLTTMNLVGSIVHGKMKTLEEHMLMLLMLERVKNFG